MTDSSPAAPGLHVTWEAYHRLIERLAVQIHASGWSFDAIVCVARGGMRVGDVLSRLFQRPLGVIFTSAYRDEGGTTAGALHLAEHLSSARPLPGDRWLVVDDLIDTGGTLRALSAALQARYPQARECRTAVLWTKDGAQVAADYCVERLPGRPWIHQPFERYDRITPDELAREFER